MLRNIDTNYLRTPHVADDQARHVRELLHQRQQEEWYRPWEAIAWMKLLLENEGEPMIEEFGRAPLPTEFGDWTYVIYGDKTNGSHHEMLVFGNIAEHALSDGEGVLVRMHSSCRTNETYHAVNCECRKELHEAMRMIA